MSLKCKAEEVKPVPLKYTVVRLTMEQVGLLEHGHHIATQLKEPPYHPTKNVCGPTGLEFQLDPSVTCHATDIAPFKSRACGEYS